MQLYKLKLSIVMLAAALFASVIFTTTIAQNNNELPIYKNEKMPLEERAKDLVSRMTLEEKV
ncbi:MAG: hypothetical protein ACTSYA_10340, partial [Candidatus Kariarchaeaceae archaeon]